MKLFKGVALLVLLTIGSIEIQSSHASSSSELSGTPGPSRVPPALDCAEPFSCARIAELRATLKADPQQPDVLMALGAELDAIGDLAGARRAYRDALQLRPRDPLAAGVHGGEVEPGRDVALLGFLAKALRRLAVVPPGPRRTRTRRAQSSPSEGRRRVRGVSCCLPACRAYHDRIAVHKSSWMRVATVTPRIGASPEATVSPRSRSRK